MARERKPRACPLRRGKNPEEDDGLLFKNRLKEARFERGLSQDELATLAGVSRQTISAIETGLFSPTARLALRLCMVLDKQFEELFYLGRSIKGTTQGEI